MNNDKRKITRMARAAKTFLLAGLVAMTCACNDFLTIYPTDKIVLEDFWKTKDDVESVVAESYRLMTQSEFMYRLLVWGELRGDNVIEGNSVPTDLRNILEANILPSNSYTSWSIFYQVINNCNVVLKYAPDVLNEDPDFTQGDLDVVCGQMYAIRALCHFYLVRTFRDIPLLTEAMVDNSQNLYQKQVTPIEALDCCLDDLKKAEDLVLTSGNYQSESDNKGRITKDAVRTMIADVLLWKAAFATYGAKGDATVAQGYYDECIDYCDKVLDARMTFVKAKQDKDKTVFSGKKMALNDSLPILYPSEVYDGYATSPKENTGRFPHRPYFELFANGCNSLCESIFEIQHATTKETGNYEVPYFYGLSNDEGKSFTVGVLSASRYLALLSNGLYGRTDFRRVGNVFSQSEGGKDLDKYGIIKYGYSSSSEDRGSLKTDNSDVYTFGKISYTFLNNGGDGFFDNNPVNWIVYRVSDVILMKAEALALRNTGNDLEVAFNLTRTVYDRSQSGYMDAEGNIFGDAQVADFFTKKFEIAKSNSQEMVKLVLDERQREFAFEGKRWFDLVRMALRSKDGTSKEMLDIMVKNKYTSNQDQYRTKMSTISSLFFPISEREINTHSGLKQNEAYKTEESVEKN